MSPNPDEIYSAKAAMEPVAPATLWLYPQLKLVKGPMQRTVLKGAKRKASNPRLNTPLTLGWLTIAALRIWAHQTGRFELLRYVDYVAPVVLLAFLVLLVVQFFRTRHFLRLEVSSNGSGGSEA